jgi:molybdopterin-guanine dinucleotide biosynthesis protein MobB
MLLDLPVFGIFGHSGSGKTSLLEQLLPALSAKGLSVAVVKSGAHHLDVDHEGKDSDRLFRAGADVFLEARDEALIRTRPERARSGPARLAEVTRSYDLVLVEGRKHSSCPKVWLLGPDENNPPPEADGAVAVLPFETDRPGAVLEILRGWLPERWREPPVYGCIVIGGRSRRMGRPKHLLPEGGRTWLERTVASLDAATDRVVLAGRGAVPEPLAHLTRLPDVPDVEGPLAGILACTRWAPWVTWLVTACDLPDLGSEALAWLLSTRRPGVWATLPRVKADGPPEPLLAHYDFRARTVLEDLAAAGCLAPSAAAGHRKVATPQVPACLAGAWENVNTASDLARRRGQEA